VAPPGFEIPDLKSQLGMTWEDVERYRDRTFRRRASLRVRGSRSALAFIGEVGFCTAFTPHPHLPSLWAAVCGERQPRMPRHTHSDPSLGLTWALKDELPDARRVFYGKLLTGKPSFVSLEYLPYFYRVMGPMGAQAGLAGPGTVEQCLLDWLSSHPPQTTFQLRRHADYRGVLSKARFEKAMARLQGLLYVVKTRTVYEPKFTYVWGLFEKAYPEAVRTARRIPAERAVDGILRKFFAVALCARRQDLLSIFRGLDTRALDAGLGRLRHTGFVRNDVKIKGAPGNWYVSNCGMMSPN
jgi:hypothetical protein